MHLTMPYTFHISLHFLYPLERDLVGALHAHSRMSSLRLGKLRMTQISSQSHLSLPKRSFDNWRNLNIHLEDADAEDKILGVHQLAGGNYPLAAFGLALSCLGIEYILSSMSL